MELFAQYGASLDRRDFDAFGRLFTEDAVYGGGGTPTHGRAAIQSQLQQTITANPSHLRGRISICTSIRRSTWTATMPQRIAWGPI